MKTSYTPSPVVQTQTINHRVFAMSVPKCCTTGIEWDGEFNGRTIPFPTSSNQAYVTGSSSSVAILFICDLFGWEFRNNRLLADHLARAVGATVYVPDLQVSRCGQHTAMMCYIDESRVQLWK